jgi:hypothetical protein
MFKLYKKIIIFSRKSLLDERMKRRISPLLIYRVTASVIITSHPYPKQYRGKLLTVRRVLLIRLGFREERITPLRYLIDISRRQNDSPNIYKQSLIITSLEI